MRDSNRLCRSGMGIVQKLRNTCRSELVREQPQLTQIADKPVDAAFQPELAGKKGSVLVKYVFSIRALVPGG